MAGMFVSFRSELMLRPPALFPSTTEPVGVGTRLVLGDGALLCGAIEKFPDIRVTVEANLPILPPSGEVCRDEPPLGVAAFDDARGWMTLRGGIGRRTGGTLGCAGAGVVCWRGCGRHLLACARGRRIPTPPRPAALRTSLVCELISDEYDIVP